jgi:hypothetical protein
MGHPLFRFFDKFQKKSSNNRSIIEKLVDSSEKNLIFWKYVVDFLVELLYTDGGAKWSKRALKWRGDEAI